MEQTVFAIRYKPGSAFMPAVSYDWMGAPDESDGIVIDAPPIPRVRSEMEIVEFVLREVLPLKPYAYCIQDGDDREYNTIDEFSGGRSNGLELYTAAQVQASIVADRAVRREMPRADVDDEENERILQIAGECGFHYDGHGSFEAHAHELIAFGKAMRESPIAVQSSIGDDVEFHRLLDAYIEDGADYWATISALVQYIDSRSSVAAPTKEAE